MTTHWRRVWEDRLTDDDRLKTCTSAIATTLLFSSAQRPGAVMGAKVEVFKRATRSKRVKEDVFVMTVAKHKTSAQGAAYITMDAEGYGRVGQYMKHLRPRWTL